MGGRGGIRDGGEAYKNGNNKKSRQDDLMIVFRLIQQFYMKKTDPKVRRFMNLQGYLEKQSKNIFVGYQMRFWRVLENGTKIGYSNQKDDPIKPENTFLIKQCLASQAANNCIFQLQTPDRTFILKAPNQEERIDWIKGITFLKKLAYNQIKLKPESSPTETTLASRSQRPKNHKKNIEKLQTTTSIKIQKPRVYQPEDLQTHKDNTESDLIAQLSKYLSPAFLKYHTLITHLKVKSQKFFIDSYNSNTYLLISPKSLYPDIHISDENLSNISLPPWLEINVFYRIISIKEKDKEIFHVNKIIDIGEGSEKCSIKINTGEIIYQFFTETIQQKECLQNCLEIATVNAEEVNINGKISKKNFDKLIDLHETRLNQFQQQAKKIINSFLKNSSQQKYNPVSLFQFMDSSMAYLRQFIEVLEHKKKNKDHVILDMLKQFHEEIKTQTKLTWDSSYHTIKGIDILNILKKLSEYHEMMKNFIKSAQFLDGMKQLSKIYVRESWKNFQSIIINIVQQQKNGGVIQDQFCEYFQTHGVTDLFKFIYNVFDLAYPHWQNKIHLHNVNKLMQRALQVFVNQMRSTIDEEFIPEKQMIGIANNYFTFSDYVKQFYTQKFSQQLAERTQQAYDKIILSYREVSMIILDKIVTNIGYSIEEYCNKCTIQTIKCDTLEEIILKYTNSLEKSLHMAFVKKIYDKIAKEVHAKICLVLIQQAKSKKKLKMKEIIRCINELKTNLSQMFSNISKSCIYVAKKMEQIEKILTNELYADVQAITAANSEPIKGYYLKILQLREDYYEGSAFYRIMNDSEKNDTDLKRKSITTQRKSAVDIAIREKNTTLSGLYFQEEMGNSDENLTEEERQKSTDAKLATMRDKLISQGYLTKGKRNQKVWQKQYFRLKNEYLYVFQTADSERCSNAIQIKSIVKVDVANPDKPSFLLTYKTLGKQKQIKLKADSIELRERWVNSIQLERKRLQNQEQVKKKSIKYRQTNTAGKKKYQMILDFWEITKGKDYFSYSS